MNIDKVGKAWLFGIAGGAAGLLAMRYYWKTASAVHGRDPRSLTREDEDRSHALDEIGIGGQRHEADESSTAAVGRIAHERVEGRAPSPEREQKLSYGVHWGYGLAMGGLYGLLRPRAKMPDAAGGAAFGTALWALGDELMVPVLGLSKGPTAYPLEQHAHRLGAHLAYGLATATVAQALHNLVDGGANGRRRLWGRARRKTRGAATWKKLEKAGRELVRTAGRPFR